MRASNLRYTVRRLLCGDTDDTFVQLFRYTFVGGLAFVVDFASLFAFTEFLGIHYLVSAALAFVLGLTTNYLLSLAWVFSRRRMAKPMVEFLIFAAIGVIGLGMNEAILWLLTGLAGVHYLVSKLVSTAVVYLWNFFARKYVLFSRPGEATCPNELPSSSGEDPRA